ncbi:hypothetical protein MN116_002129 [Schistosoma mekongi]|uniref:Uncharacterized protein n=1 Tax=Schistosoma mekongi TaxID=38744 RepID=A0AAE1ZJZ5_SCHME|nr:hypothetical protein MN116_002129 [Schistosoma mekongi]
MTNDVYKNGYIFVRIASFLISGIIMFMKVIVMLCFMQYMICEEMTEMMTTESSNKTESDLHQPINITPFYNKTDQSSNLTYTKTNADDVNDNDVKDSDFTSVRLIKRSLAVILVYLCDLLLITVN